MPNKGANIMRAVSWVEKLAPSYREVWRRRVLSILGREPGSIWRVAQEAGIPEESRVEFIAEMIGEGLIVSNRAGDVLSLPGDAPAAVNPLAAVCRAEFDCGLGKGRRPTWVVTCRRCSAGWLLDADEVDSPAGAFHVRSILAHIATHAGETGGGL